MPSIDGIEERTQAGAAANSSSAARNLRRCAGTPGPIGIDLHADDPFRALPFDRRLHAHRRIAAEQPAPEPDAVDANAA